MPVELGASSTAAGKANSRSAELFVIIIAMVFFLGAFLRINRYLQNRSLYIDEAMFALNILERTPVQLVGPLSYDQTSPVGFTLLVKLLTMAFGVSEPVLRLVPLLAGLASLPLFYILAKTWLPKWASLLAVVLFAVSDELGNYAAWFDKYSSDVTLTIIILLVGLWFYDSRRRTRYLVFGIVGVVAVWFSYPVSIVLAGIGLPLFFLALGRNSRKEALLVAVMAGCWLASAAALWGVSVWADLESPSRGAFWASSGGFLVFPPLTVAQVEKDIRILVRPFEEPLGFAFYGGVVLLYGLGAIDAVRTGGTRLFLVTPFLITIALSALRLYPLYVRLILFLVPLLLLTVVMGIVRFSEELTSRTEKILAFGFLALTLYQPFRIGLARGLHPRESEEIRPLIIRQIESYRPGDVLALYYGAQPAYRYYAYHLGVNQGIPVDINNHRGAPERYCEDVKPLVAHPRVWVLFSHSHGAEEKIIVDCLDRLGEQQSKLQETGASLYLYDLRAVSDGSAPGD